VMGTRDADKSKLVAFLADRSKPSAINPAEFPAPERPLHTRAFVKAQEGCNDVCAFCIVPQTRGREESRSIERVTSEIDRAVGAGAREVVVTGTQLGAWGRDLEPGLQPHHLISAILERTDVLRVRFSSLQPQDITPELLGLWQDPRLMPHFHLALQSGSQRVLEAMRRRYSRREFLEAAARIQAAVPGAAITTDVIAGFPGETDEEFEKTLALCREVGFARMHCFPYSPRNRTLAARLPGRTLDAVRKARMERLLVLGEELSIAFRQRFQGTVRPVLWEGERTINGQRLWQGHTDNYIAVYMGGKDLHNRVTPVLIGEVYDDGVRGVVPGEAV
jgi:threonylcarbamoyladenosine tRNA methylthiotransferase MtaB